MQKGCMSADKYTFSNGHYRKLDFQEVISESSANFQQQGAFSGEMNIKSSERLSKRLACCVKGHDCTYEGTHGTMDKHFLDKETIEMLKSILTRIELKKDEAGMSPQASNTNLELQNFKLNLNPSKPFHLQPGHCVHSNVKSAVVKVAHKPSQTTLNSKSMEKDSDRNDGNLLLKGKHLNFLDAMQEKLQQKDLEIQQIAQLLLIKQQELKDARKMAKVKEAEAQLMVQKLKCEEQKNAEVAKRLNNACEDMREKLCIAKDNNENFVKQLKALLEKYERLKERAATVKQQLREECSKKKSSQKTVKKIELMAEELLRSQVLLEKQRDAATRELSVCRTKIQVMGEEHKDHVRIIQRVQEEASAIRADYLNLKEEQCKTQEENKKLKEAVHSKDLEKGKAEKELMESRNTAEQLYAELDESKIQRQAMHQELETIKKELKLLYNRHNVEKRQAQEEQMACKKQSEGMRMECEALKEVVSKLKKDKHVLKEELECLQKEKARSEAASQCEGQKMREAVSLLQRERALLLDEMRDLRKDYFGLSDRITHRLGQLDQGDAPMCITDISTLYQNQTSKESSRVVPVASNADMIEQIRRKLEEEESIQKE